MEIKTIVLTLILLLLADMNLAQGLFLCGACIALVFLILELMELLKPDEPDVVVSDGDMFYDVLQLPEQPLPRRPVVENPWMRLQISPKREESRQIMYRLPPRSIQQGEDERIFQFSLNKYPYPYPNLPANRPHPSSDYDSEYHTPTEIAFGRTSRRLSPRDISQKSFNPVFKLSNTEPRTMAHGHMESPLIRISLSQDSTGHKHKRSRDLSSSSDREGPHHKSKNKTNSLLEEFSEGRHRHKSKSPHRHKSKSPHRHKSKSSHRHKSKSPHRHKSKSPHKRSSKRSHKHKRKSSHRKKSRKDRRSKSIHRTRESKSRKKKRSTSKRDHKYKKSRKYSRENSLSSSLSSSPDYSPETSSTDSTKLTRPCIVKHRHHDKSPKQRIGYTPLEEEVKSILHRRDKQQIDNVLDSSVQNKSLRQGFQKMSPTSEQSPANKLNRASRKVSSVYPERMNDAVSDVARRGNISSRSSSEAGDISVELGAVGRQGVVEDVEEAASIESFDISFKYAFDK